LVLTLPSSSTVKLGVPFDCKESRVLSPALVSFMTKAVAVPASVRLSEVAVPEPRVKSRL